jgi:hypothetical protein
MATTTPNYGWTVPTSTDLVKDGATAIETLGDAIDASMNTALGTKKAGMVLLNTTSFSGVASQSFNNVFTSTYENYKVFVNWTGTVDEFLLIRFRAAGSDNTSLNYYSMDFSMLSNSTTLSGGQNNASSSGRFGYQGASVETSHLEAAIFSPQISTKTTGWNGQSVRWGGAVSSWRPFGGSLSVTTAYDGFTLIPGSGNISGVCSVYGMAK